MMRLDMQSSTFRHGGERHAHRSATVWTVPGRCLRALAVSAVVVIVLLLVVPPTAAQMVTQPGPDGTPQFDRAIERRGYFQAAPDALLTYASIVFDEARQLPPDANPERVKNSDLRKRLLDLRLMLDFNAFLYDPERLDVFREQVDTAYEAVGLFKDLFDQTKLTGQPINPADEAARAAAMRASLAWLREPDQRQAFTAFVQRPEGKVLDLTLKERPRLWRVADVTPGENKSALAVVALVAGNGLSNLLHDGLLVDDILDEDQEARFHDIRKALRSILVLVDMFPTAEDVVGDRREPLAKLVDAYGDVNDASIAYHEAQDAGRDAGDLRDKLVKEYKQARTLAQELSDNGQLREYVTRLTPLQLFDVDPFH